jgi:TetR/AcrR family transcriptional regulator
MLALESRECKFRAAFGRNFRVGGGRRSRALRPTLDAVESGTGSDRPRAGSSGEQRATNGGGAGGGTRDAILAAASHRFAERGYAGTSLAEIAEAVGIRTPSLFHYFPSKRELYRAVLLDAFDDWFTMVAGTIADPADGWAQVEHILRTAFRFFGERPDFVRLARWEALDGGPVLADELAALLRPMFERSVGFLEKEMRAGRVRTCDAPRLVITGYGAILSYLSDAPLVGSLLGEDPRSPDALKAEQEHIVDLFRHALLPSPVDALPSP